MRISYGLLEYQVEKLFSLVLHDVPFSDQELNRHMKYIEEFVADCGYTMDEYTDLFLDRKDSSHTLTYIVADLTRDKKDLP